MLKYFKPVGSEVAASKRTRDDAPIASVSSSSSPIVLASAGAGSGLSANREASDVAAAEVAILEEQAAAGNPSAQDQLDILKTSKPASTTGAQASGADAEWRSKLAKLHESISAGSSSAASAAGSLGAAAGQGAASLSATDAAEALSALGISVHSSWAPTVLAEAKKPYFKQLEAHLLSERGKHGDHRIFPAHANVYSALALTPLDQIKVGGALGLDGMSVVLVRLCFCGAEAMKIVLTYIIDIDIDAACLRVCILASNSCRW